MYIYLLKRTDPKTLQFDQVAGFVIRAPSERAARNIAAKNRGDEDPSE